LDKPKQTPLAYINQRTKIRACTIGANSNIVIL